MAEVKARGAPQSGSLTVIGCAPADPDLLTLRDVRALQSADVVVFDPADFAGHSRFRPARGDRECRPAWTISRLWPQAASVSCG